MLLRREDESNIEDINLISHIYIHSLSDTEETAQEQSLPSEVVTVTESLEEIAIIETPSILEEPQALETPAAAAVVEPESTQALETPAVESETSAAVELTQE